MRSGDCPAGVEPCVPRETGRPALMDFMEVSPMILLVGCCRQPGSERW